MAVGGYVGCVVGLVVGCVVGLVVDCVVVDGEAVVLTFENIGCNVIISSLLVLVTSLAAVLLRDGNSVITELSFVFGVEFSIGLVVVDVLNSGTSVVGIGVVYGGGGYGMSLAPLFEENPIPLEVQIRKCQLTVLKEM